MSALAPDEKTTPVMIYTHRALIHGELVSKENVRVNSLLRGDNAPDHLRLLNAQYLELVGSQPRSANFPELYYPLGQVIGIHLAPSAQEPLDYDPSEKNRIMKPVVLLVGAFVARCKARISSQVDFGTSLTTAHAWMSVYDVEIGNPSLPQMPVLRVPMMIVRPNQVGFALQE